MPSRWVVSDRILDLGRPVVMGILNATPDSFSDGGELGGVAGAVDRAAAMVRAGAGILDVGGESTRPHADYVDPAEEIDRVVPVIEALAARFEVTLSVDTRKAAVAREALGRGAHIVNDVSGLVHDPEMGRLVAASGAGLVLMHMRGDPSDMRDLTGYEDVVGEVVAELRDRLEGARAAGVADERVVVDPGIGFAKTSDQTFLLLRHLDALLALGRPLLVGPGRKSFLGSLLRVPPKERVAGTAAACIVAYLAGARIFRVHDVKPVVDALRVAHRITTAA